MKRRMLALLLTVTMVLGLAVSVSATEVVASGHGWYVDWVLTTDGTLTVSGNGSMRDSEHTFDPPWGKYRDEIKSVVVCEGVTAIEESAFCGLYALTQVTIAESVEQIGRNAFSDCPSLQSIRIPAAVTKLGVAVFTLCDSLTEIIVAEENANYASVDGVLMNKEQTTLIQVPGGKTGAYTIPESVTTIERSALSHCRKLTSVTFPDHLSELPEAVLYMTESLTTVELPASLTAIPRAAFYEDVSLTAIEIPSCVTSIGMDAFYGCTSLKTVTVPAAVEVINTQAFGGCGALTDVVFQGDAPSLEYGIFMDDTLTAWYPAGNETWTEEVMQDYYGNVTWKSYAPLPFTDVPLGSFYYDPVAWAVENSVTNGISAAEFGPNASCNRAQVVTFLWRAAGEPEPAVTEHTFVDVEKGSFYEKAVLWAVENGITTGTDETHFSPSLACNRATVVTFLYRAFGEPAVEDAANHFTDVPAGDWYTAPVLWAVENGITNGLSAAEFGPNTPCNRAQIVTFLYRAYTD